MDAARMTMVSGIGSHISSSTILCPSRSTETLCAYQDQESCSGSAHFTNQGALSYLDTVTVVHE